MERPVLVVPVTLMLTTAGPLRSVIAAKLGTSAPPGGCAGAAATSIGLTVLTAALAGCSASPARPAEPSTPALTSATQRRRGENDAGIREFIAGPP
jgi:hypothetical protein